MVPGENEQSDALPSCFSIHSVNKCPFHSLFSATFSTFCSFCCDFAILNGPRSAEVLYNVPKFRKTVTCLTEKKAVREASFRPEL